MDIHERHMQRHEIDDLEEMARVLADESEDLSDYVVHAVDLTGFEGFGAHDLTGVIFLGCIFTDEAQRRLVEDHGAYVFPRLSGLPYEPFRTTLYSVDELMQGYDDGGYVGTMDFEIYTHFDRARRRACGVPIRETLAQRLHDHAIDDAKLDVLARHQGKGVVGVMGGHGAARTDAAYREVVRACWMLTRAGYFITSGGGPGIMEAANLGAYLANYADEGIIDHALEMLSGHPRYAGGQTEGTPEYLQAIKDSIQAAVDVVAELGPGASSEIAERFGRERAEPGASLAVPTWFYGHEPSNMFSTYVAKYFSNSIREDGLLAISLGGVLYAPGSAGTMQEVFMDLAQNHYATFKWRSPMVFMGEEAFGGVVDLINAFVERQNKQEVYGDLISLVPDADEAVAFILANPPRKREPKKPLYELV